MVFAPRPPRRPQIELYEHPEYVLAHQLFHSNVFQVRYSLIVVIVDEFASQA